ncbi:unnamed protein product [Angiostrongylus costaricensis]|uniref:Stage II sporulation protein M n=1 Tax=Angiostrongylus costaricensis TaxID=334426 RepID=A0A0R3Q092_ANGCS|nr:unnamed protein product [Angiostrongylus costaricensis]
MTEVAERYVEQIQTTVETMRRRVLAYYDGVFFIGNKLITAAERARDVAEPVAYDVKDYVSGSCGIAGHSPHIFSDSRTFSCSMKTLFQVLMLGISSGELAGAFVFPPVLEYIFDLYVEVIVLFLIPTYVYLNIRKNAGLSMDDTERRTCLFGFCLASGILLGHLIGGTLTSIVPSVFFIPPLLLALLVSQCKSQNKSCFGILRSMLMTYAFTFVNSKF